MRLPPTAAGWRSCQRVPSMLGPADFRFIGQQHTLQQASDWNHPQWPKLWLYNAHYFDDLVADDAARRSQWHRALLQRWIAENPPAAGNGWEPYPISLRAVNWIKWALAGNALDTASQHSLAVQIRHLRKRLEVHLLGNHLWANLKALLFASAWFDGEEAQAWRAHALPLFQRELGEQILDDGGHFERSPMYHAVLLEDLLDLVQLSTLYPDAFSAATVAQWRATAARMLRWLRVMSHPDGGIAFFNDAALGIAPSLAALQSYANDLGVAWDSSPLQDVEHLATSGYVRLQNDQAVVIADVGVIGPDYLPGHAHADTLSFELSVHGQRVLVNGGTSTYEANALRLRQRGTAMHNTVTVDDQDSSEVWSSFRVARRARPMGIAIQRESGALMLSAAHDGYQRLPGKVTHLRTWHLESDRLTIVDTLHGKASQATARYRFAPGWSPSAGGLTGPGQQRVMLDDLPAGQRMVDDYWYPRFGEQLPCHVLEIEAAHGAACTLRWNRPE